MNYLLQTIIASVLLSFAWIASANGSIPLIQSFQRSLGTSKISTSVGAFHQLGITISSDQYLSRIESAIPLLQYYARELQANNLPTYYAFIPLVESMNRVDALSPKGAFGVWQLMPETAQNFGAKVSSNIDERQSIILSTRYALRFLATLENQLDHPIYVLAAYNWGLASVNKIKSSLLYPEQLLTSPLVPQETRHYVSSILGYWDTVINLKDSHRLMYYPDVNYLNQIIVNQYPFLNIDAGLMALLNHPNYNGGDRLIPSENFYTFFSGPRSSQPMMKIATSQPIISSDIKVLKSLNQIDQCNTQEEQTSFQIYVVNQDDTVSQIASKLNMSTNELLRYIPKGKVSPGNVLLIPENNSLKSC